MNRYDVTVTREGAWWMVAIPSIDGLTQTRRLAEALGEARSYITVDQDLAPSEVEVNLTALVVHGTDVLAQQRRIEELREQQAAAERALREVSESLARQLVAEEVPLRDVGTVLHVSHQRAHQLVS